MTNTCKVTYQHVWGLYLDELLVYDVDADADGDFDEIDEENGDKRYYALQDFIYSTHAVINSSGTVQERYDYAPYGAPTRWNASYTGHLSLDTRHCCFLFTGQMYDAESGLYHYKFRAYHAGAGRFLQHDPIGYDDGMSLYEYCGTAPIARVDAHGTMREQIQDPGPYYAHLMAYAQAVYAGGGVTEAEYTEAVAHIEQTQGAVYLETVDRRELLDRLFVGCNAERHFKYQSVTKRQVHWGHQGHLNVTGGVQFEAGALFAKAKASLEGEVGYQLTYDITTANERTTEEAEIYKSEVNCKYCIYFYRVSLDLNITRGGIVLQQLDSFKTNKIDPKTLKVGCGEDCPWDPPDWGRVGPDGRMKQ